MKISSLCKEIHEIKFQALSTLHIQTEASYQNSQNDTLIIKFHH